MLIITRLIDLDRVYLLYVNDSLGLVIYSMEYYVMSCEFHGLNCEFDNL